MSNKKTAIQSNPDTANTASEEKPASAKRATEKPTLKYKRGRAVTVPMRKLNNNDIVVVEFTGEFSAIMLEAGGKKSPATLARITNLDTGVVEDLILNTVLHSTLEKYGQQQIKAPTVEEAERRFEWKVEALANKKLELTSTKRPDKNYFDVFAYEVDVG